MPPVLGPRDPGSPSVPMLHGCCGHEAACWHPLDTVPSLGYHPLRLGTGVKKGLMASERGSWEERRQCPLGSGVKKTGLLSILPNMDPSVWETGTVFLPLPMVPPGTQGPQLLLGLVPAPGGCGGQRGLG